MINLNKKQADEKIIYIYWFFIIFLVATAIFYMVFNFYGQPYDARPAETNILINKISDCIYSESKFNQEVFSNNQLQITNENFQEKCNLNFQTEDVYEWNTLGQYYVNLSILDFNSKELIDSIEMGNANLRNYCNLKENENIICKQRSFYTIDKSQNQYEIKIYTSIRKTEKNV